MHPICVKTNMTVQYLQPKELFEQLGGGGIHPDRCLIIFSLEKPEEALPYIEKTKEVRFVSPCPIID